MSFDPPIFFYTAKQKHQIMTNVVNIVNTDRGIESTSYEVSPWIFLQILPTYWIVTTYWLHLHKNQCECSFWYTYLLITKSAKDLIWPFLDLSRPFLEIFGLRGYCDFILKDRFGLQRYTDAMLLVINALPLYLPYYTWIVTLKLFFEILCENRLKLEFSFEI